MDFEEIAVEIEVSGLARRNIMQSTKTKGSGIKATIKKTTSCKDLPDYELKSEHNRKW